MPLAGEHTQAPISKDVMPEYHSRKKLVELMKKEKEECWSFLLSINFIYDIHIKPEGNITKVTLYHI